MTSSLLDANTRPEIADSFFDWQRQDTSKITVGPGGIVAVAATGTWGPINTVVEIKDPSKVVANFGSDSTPLTRAINDAFIGHGYTGFGGASKVQAVRIALASAVKGTRVLVDTAGSPAAALTLTAKWTGSRFNALRWTVQASALGGKELLILDGSFPVETYQIPATDIAALAAEINAKSKWVTAVADQASATLANVSAGSPTTSGTDGSAVTGTEWDLAFTQLDRVRWHVFAPYGLTDGTIRAAIRAWIQERNSIGQRCMAITGGAAGESLTTANTRSQGLNSWNMINLGSGSHVRTDEPGTPTRSTAELVARYAGARAFRGERAGDLMMRFAGVEIVDGNGATLAEHSLARSAGTTVLERDTHEVPVFIREAVTTYTDDSASPVDDDGNKVFDADNYSDVRGVYIQQGIELDVGDLARSGNTVGNLPNTAKDRQVILGYVRDAYERREAARIVQPGWKVSELDNDDNNDYVAYLHEFKPTRSIRQLINVARVG